MTSPHSQATPGRRDWSRAEVEATVADYFDMYTAELAGVPYNKSAHRRALLARLDDRSDGAVEDKHRNISAVLAEQGLPFIDGYKPRSHYQQILKDEVLTYLDSHEELLRDVDRPGPEVPDIVASTDSFVAPPGQSDLASGQGTSRTTRDRDYVLLARENTLLGAAGEEFVVALEQRRLEGLGRADLAERVERVSVSQGDGLGFDVLSFREDASELHIEVKTTKYGAATPFYLSAREEAYSREAPDRFCLYRVFGWPDAKVFCLEGPVVDHFRLTPSTFKAVR